jgi:hypothetical protein
MKFEVELNMFQNGAIRVVDVPDQALNGQVEHDLDQIFYYGQNDVRPISDRVSVSAGDVIRYHGTRYMICGVGFKKLENGGALSSDPHKRIQQLFETKGQNDQDQDTQSGAGHGDGPRRYRPRH